MANNKNNYITNMINKYGENWIVTTNPEDIQKAGKRIVKEMAKGQFNYEEVGKYFLDGKFLDNIIIFTKNELDSNTLYLNAVDYYAKFNPDAMAYDIGIQISRLQALCYIYNLVYNRLCNVRATGNIGYLHDIAAFLNIYARYIN